MPRPTSRSTTPRRCPLRHPRVLWSSRTGKPARSLRSPRIQPSTTVGLSRISAAGNSRRSSTPPISKRWSTTTRVRSSPSRSRPTPIDQHSSTEQSKAATTSDRPSNPSLRMPHCRPISFPRATATRTAARTRCSRSTATSAPLASCGVSTRTPPAAMGDHASMDQSTSRQHSPSRATRFSIAWVS